MNTRKIVIVFIVIIALSLGICVAVKAEGEQIGEDGTPTVSTGTEGEGGIAVDENKTDGGENGDTGVGGNPFDKLYATVESHAAEILGVLTFITSLILTYAYRRSLMPLIRATLKNLGDGVATIKECTKGESERRDKESGEIIKKIESTDKSLLDLARGVDALSKELYEYRLDKEEREKIKSILSLEIDMLYNVFMNSSLPEYQKEDMCRHVTQMREAIKGEQ